MDVSLVNGILLSSEKDMVVKAASGGSFEAETFRYIDSVLHDGDLVVDVGAYSGVYSLYCAKNFNAVCYAFEPNPALYGRLNSNIELNDLHRSIHAMNFGLSNRRGSQTFYTSPSTPLTSAGSLEPGRGKTLSQQVDTEVYDDLPQSVLSVDLIKIDVEGHERSVLDGMVYTLKRDHPVVVVECLTGKELVACDQLLIEDLGYERIACLDERNYAYEYKQ